MEARSFLSSLANASGSSSISFVAESVYFAISLRIGLSFLTFGRSTLLTRSAESSRNEIFFAVSKPTRYFRESTLEGGACSTCSAESPRRWFDDSSLAEDDARGVVVSRPQCGCLTFVFDLCREVTPDDPPRRPRTFPPDACPIKGIPRGPKITGVSTDEDASAASEADMLLKVSSSVSLTSASLPPSRR